MSDKRMITYGHLCMTDPAYGFVTFDGAAFKLQEGEWHKHCAEIANAGANSLRIFPYGVWGPRPHGRKGQFQPWVYVSAIDKWDIGRFNECYFPIMRRIIQIANTYNLEVRFPWFDNCQLIKGYWTAYSPWKHNVQGVTTFYEEAADPYTWAFIMRSTSEFRNLRVAFPWGNELSGLAVKWAQRLIFPLLPGLGVPWEKMTYGAVMEPAPYLGDGKYADKFTTQDTIRKQVEAKFGKDAKLKIMREVHACGRKAVDQCLIYGHNAHQAAYWWGNKPVGKWIAADDGVNDQGPESGGRPNADRWYSMALWHFQNYQNIGGLEHCPETLNLKTEVGIIRGMSRAYHDAFGAWPENYGQHQYVPPTPPPPPVPEPPPPSPPPTPPPAPEKPWWHWWFGPNSLWGKFCRWVKEKLFGRD